MKTQTQVLVLIFILFSAIKMFRKIPQFDNQENFKFRLSDYLDTIGFETPDFTQIDCDFRVWHTNYATGQNRLIRLQLQ